MEVAKADVIKASRHPRFRPVDVENYLLPGSTQRDRSRRRRFVFVILESGTGFPTGSA
jgi:hypothetical protein